jgi:hypothetical protein
MTDPLTSRDAVAKSIADAGDFGSAYSDGFVFELADAAISAHLEALKAEGWILTPPDETLTVEDAVRIAALHDLCTEKLPQYGDALAAYNRALEKVKNMLPSAPKG